MVCGLGKTPDVVAQTTYTNANNTALWSDGGNWSSGEPTSLLEAVFPAVIPAAGSPLSLSAGELANSLTFNNTYTLNAGDLTLTTGSITVAPTFTATLNSTLLGTAGLTVNPTANLGTGVLTLGGTNTFTGAVAVQAGTLRFANITAINAASATNDITLGTTTTTATLDYTGASATIARVVNLGSLAGSPTGNVINVATAGQTLTLSGRILGGPATTNTALTITGPGTVFFSNNAVTLGTQNDFTGNIVVDGGSVQVVGLNGVNNVAGGTLASEGTQFGTGDKTITLTNGGRFINNTTTFNPIADVGFSKGIIIGAGGGTIEANAQISLDDANQFGGTAAGGQLTKTGAGRLLLGQASTSYDGAQTFVNAGVLELRDANSLGDNLPSLTTKSVINLAAGTTLDLRNNAATAFNYPVVAAGNATFNVDRTTANSGLTHTLGPVSIAGGTITVTGGNTFALATGVVTLNGNPTFDATSANLTVASLDAGAASPARTITKSGAAFMAVTGAGTNFTGTTVVNVTGGGMSAGTPTSFGPAANVSVSGTGSQYLQLGAASGYNYTFAADTILAGNNAFLASLNTTGAGTNLNLFPNTIAQTEAGGNAALAARVGFANDASRIFAIAANVGDASLTVGTGTPWAGVGNDRLARSLPTPVIIANSDFALQAGGGGTFTFGNAGTPSITLGGGATAVTATVRGGVVVLGRSAPSYPNTVTFAVANGATLQPTAANAFGTNTTAGGAGNNASVSVLNGGAFNPNVVALNANITIQVGGILNIDDAANLSGTGSITQFPGSITRITANGSTALGGTLSSGTVPGSIVRFSTANVVGLGTGGVTGTNPASNYVINGASTTINSVTNLGPLAAAALTLNSAGNVVVAGTIDPIPTGTFSNDGSSRVVTSNSSTVNSVITIGANGGTIAASTGTTLTFRTNPTASSTVGVSIAGGSNTLNFGVPAGSGLIDGQAKSGTVDFGGGTGVSIVAGSVNVYSGILQNLGGGMTYNIGGGTGVTRVYNGAQLISATGTLSNTTLQVDAGGFGRFRAGGTDNVVATQQIAGLQGTGSVTIGNSAGTNRDVILTIGANNANTTFSGVISDQDGTRNGGITKTGTGTLSLAGANTYTLATAVNLGTLALTGGSLGGTAVTVGTGATPTASAGNATLLIAGNRSIGTATAGSLNIIGGNTGGTPLGQGTLSLVDGTVNTLTLTDRTPTNANTFTFGSNTAGNNAVLNLEIGATADRIQLGAGDTATIGTGGTNIINLVGIGGLTGTTPLVLIDAPGGLAAGSFSNFTLGTVTGNFAGYSGFTLGSSATQLFLNVPALVGTGNAFWTGDVDGNWSTVGNTNFATDITGATDLGALPGPGSNVTFTANTAGNLATTLGADTAINSLTFTGTGTPAAAGVTISGNTLTLNATNANGNTAGTGIVVAAGSGAHTISSNVVVGASQSWTNSSSNLFTVSGNVDLGSNVLTVAGTGSNALSGVVSGAGGLLKTGTGVTTLSAANTYAGATTINQGTLAFTTNQSLAGGFGFGSAANTTTVGTLDLSAANATFGSFVAQNNSTTANVVTIGAGRTLTINGNVSVGSATDGATTVVNMTGLTGTLTVNNVGGTFRVGVGPTAANLSSTSNLNLSGLGTFNADLGAVGSLTVGASSDNDATDSATFSLAATANTITAGTINIGNSGAGAAMLMRLGGGTNFINANTIALGIGGRDSGQILFQGAGGSVVVRAANGAGRAILNLGTTGGGTTSYGHTNSFSTTGHNADLLLGAVTLGGQPTRAGAATNNLSFDQGTLDASSLTLSAGKTAGAGSVTSTVDIGGGTVNISNGVLQMGNNAATTGTVGASIANLNITGGNVTIGATSGVAIRTATATTAGYTATATINVTGGSTTLAGDIVRGGGSVNATTTLTLNGGLLNLGGNAIGDATNPINNLNFQSGTLANVASINGSGGLTKTTTGTLTITGTSAYAGPTAVSAGTLLVNGSITGVGAVTVATGSTLGGTGSIAGPITVSSGAVLSAGNGIAPADDLVSSGGFTLGDGSTIQLTLGGGGAHSTLARTGGTTIFDTDQAFAFIDAGAQAGTYDNIITGLAADPITTAWTITTPSFVGTFSYDGGGGPGNIDLVLTAVPEPATAALLAIGGIGLLSRRRRR